MDEVKKVIELIRSNANQANAVSMAAYMQNKFLFAGIKKPILSQLIKPFLKKTASQPLDWSIVLYLWENEYREAQYTAIEYIIKHKKMIVSDDIDIIKRLIVTKSWWDTVDFLDAVVGQLALDDIKIKNLMLEWAIDENIWLRRVAIDFQQQYKEKTDFDFLTKIIKLNFGQKEFFINKAIGWSLREYGKTNPSAVKNFAVEYKSMLSPLSYREALKIIGKEEK